MDPSFLISKRMAQIELDNLIRNRAVCDPSMRESIDARIEELKKRISVDFVPNRVKLRKIERL